jgi:hypothetical protein
VNANKGMVLKRKEDDEDFTSRLGIGRLCGN